MWVDFNPLTNNNYFYKDVVIEHLTGLSFESFFQKVSLKVAFTKSDFTSTNKNCTISLSNSRGTSLLKRQIK